MSPLDKIYDYIIIGSGAGGSAAAWRLARAGREVLLLEKGQALPRDGSTLDTDKVLKQGLFKNKEAWSDRRGRALVPEEFFNLGGKTKWYGAALLRFAEDEFGGDTERRHLPWPISRSELLPYYEEAEGLLGVRQFPVEPDLKGIVDRLQANGAGWCAQPLPLGLSAEITEFPQEARHFDGFASPRGLKADAERRLLDGLQNLPNLKIITGAEVVELLGARGRPQCLTGVACRDGRRFHGTCVLLAGGAMHSPRLLQRYLEQSRLADSLPSAQLVGSHYKRHVLTAVLGFSLARRSDDLRKTVLITNRRFPHSSVQPLGGWIDREIVASMLPRFLPRALVRFIGERVYGFFLQTEDGSHPQNRVRAANGHGRPQLDYDIARLPRANAEHRGLVRSFLVSLFKAGMFAVSKRIPLEGSAHSCGTLVTGRDPLRSVVDAQGRVHGMDNLYVVDGSVLPRSSRMNPALTIYAWSLRVADRLQQAGARA